MTVFSRLTSSARSGLGPYLPETRNPPTGEDNWPIPQTALDDVPTDRTYLLRPLAYFPPTAPVFPPRLSSSLHLVFLCTQTSHWSATPPYIGDPHPPTVLCPVIVIDSGLRIWTEPHSSPRPLVDTRKTNMLPNRPLSCNPRAALPLLPCSMFPRRFFLHAPFCEIPSFHT